MKYRNIKIGFNIDNVTYSVISICLEKLTEPIPMHSHSRNSYELHYIVSGYGVACCNDIEYRLAPGSYYVTGPGIHHEQTSIRDNPMTEFCIYLQAKESLDNAHASKKSGLKKNNPKITVTADDESMTNNEDIEHCSSFTNHKFWIGVAGDEINALMKQIITELETQRTGYGEILESLIRLFVLQTIRLYSEENPQKQGGKRALDSEPGNRTYLIIEEEFLYNYRLLTLDSLANKIGFGKRQTERLMKAHYGHTFQQMKQEARISAACGMLRDTAMTVAEIAEFLGYSSSEHFSYSFKKVKGITAIKYRKENTKENTK